MTKFDLPLTTREMWNCFNIRSHNGRGTMFFISGENGQICVSAKHILAGSNVGDNVLIATKNGDVSRRIKQLVFANDDSDICLFRLEDLELWYEIEDFAPSKPQVPPGGMLKFLGFPHGLSGTYPDQKGFPSPLVRNAFFSGVIHIGNTVVAILDGFNNPGYSGGPIYCFSASGEVTLFGVICGYRFEQEAHARIFKKDADGNEQMLPDVYVKPNSGMIYAAPLKHICELRTVIDG